MFVAYDVLYVCMYLVCQGCTFGVSGAWWCLHIGCVGWYAVVCVRGTVLYVGCVELVRLHVRIFVSMQGDCQFCCVSSMFHMYVFVVAILQGYTINIISPLFL